MSNFNTVAQFGIVCVFSIFNGQCKLSDGFCPPLSSGAAQNFLLPLVTYNLESAGNLVIWEFECLPSPTWHGSPH